MVDRSSESADAVAGESRSGTLAAMAAFCARLLIVGVALYVLGRIAARLQAIVIPVLVAVLLAALLAPLVTWLTRRRWPRWAATTTVLLGGLLAVAGVLTFVVVSFIAGLPALQQQLVASVQAAHDWAIHGPLGLDPQQLGQLQQQVVGWLQSNQQRLASGALTTAVTVGSLLTGAVLMLFALVFFLHSGGHIWRGISRIAPAGHRDNVERAGRRAFTALISYTRAVGLVAAADALGIGLGLWIVGVPLAGPLTALVFLSGFLPVLGAVVSGAVAVLVTLVTNGPIAALIILAVVLVVQQVEGNLLQPWLLGDAAQLHPLGVVLAVTTGATVASVTGALLAVPLVMVARACVQVWTSPAPPDSQTQHHN